MSTTKKKKTAREKRVLIASLIVAGAIVAGSTFAWFTSKDEVTNRLSASANYGVAIAEDFQSPEDWVPGQTINKDVSAVNTGNVDAFVRMWIEGEMSVFNRTTQANSVAMPGNNVTALTATTDEQYKNSMFTYKDASDNYYRELDKTTKRDNPLNNGASTQDSTEDNKPAQFTEVQAMQAGGYLAYVPTNANYSFKVEQATTIEAYASNSASDKTVINLKAGDIVATKNSGVTATAYLEDGTADIYIDTSEFYPQTEGVYLFRRNVAPATAANTTDDYEYSGYYYVPANGKLIANDTNDHYLALYTDGSTTGGSDRSDYTVPDNAVEPGTYSTVKPSANMKFFNAKENVVESSSLTWTYTAASGTDPDKLTATYAGTDASATTDDITIDIALANIGTDSEKWTAITDKATNPTNKTTFYYNNDVEAGDTTTKLVDSVALSKDTTQKAYLAFDFDLNVYLESVQVTMDESGKELCTSVNSWAASTGNTGAKPMGEDTAKTYNTTDTNEIDVVDWVAVTAGP